MCTKKPKTPEEKPPVFLTNPLLSGITIGSGVGRNSLRTDSAPTVTGPSAVVAERDGQQRASETALNAAGSSARNARGLNSIFEIARYGQLRIKHRREF